MPHIRDLGIALVIVGFLAGGLRAADEAHPDGEHAAQVDADHGGDHGGGNDELPGMNPFGISGDFRADLPLWSAITFLVFFLLLARFAWGPLRDSLDAREAKIRQDIVDAETNREKALSLLKEYDVKLARVQEDVREILAEARRDAETAKLDILGTAERESAAMRQRAVADIERARDQALGELFDFVSQNVIQATEQVVGRSLTGADQERLVREALENLELRKN